MKDSHVLDHDRSASSSHGFRCDCSRPVCLAWSAMKVDVEGLPDAHGLISGPQCPPWSKIGCKRAWGDKRAAVFLTVLKWIFHLAGRRNSVFTFFVLENVDGMRSRSGNQKESPSDTVLNKLRRGMPGGWYIQTLSCNSHCSIEETIVLRGTSRRTCSHRAQIACVDRCRCYPARPGDRRSAESHQSGRGL